MRDAVPISGRDDRGARAMPGSADPVSGTTVMLQPKRTKYRKAFKGRIHGKAKGGTELNSGAYGLKALTPGRLSARPFEAARPAIPRHMNRDGKMWNSRFPDVPGAWNTAEGGEAREGRGSGGAGWG